MNSPITQRFIRCHDQLKLDRRIRSSRQFAQSLDYLPQSLSEILKCRRDVTIELLRKAVEKYRMNPTYLLTGEGAMFVSEEEQKGLRVLAIVTTPENEERIVHVPVPAQAGYPAACTDPAFVGELPSYSLPGDLFSQGTYRSFDVSGDSMEPTLVAGDKVVCHYLEPAQWVSSIKTGHVHVLVTRTGVLAKRLGKRIGPDRGLALLSDNPSYPPQETDWADILEIWAAKLRITALFPPPDDREQALQQEITALREELLEQQRLVRNLNGTIEMLLSKK
jgi:phage repressor protein C with HTH and peptisase S24 domain